MSAVGTNRATTPGRGERDLPRVGISAKMLINVVRRNIFDIEPIYSEYVTDAKWTIVVLDDKKKVMLAGVYIPFERTELNYKPNLVDVVGDMLIGKKVKVELLEKARSGAHHKHDLVKIYLYDGTCINEYLLKNGLAFFSHEYYRGKDRDFMLEAKAKQGGKGIWANKEDLKLLYVGSKNWKGVHYPECPEADKIKPDDRIEFYHRPFSIYWYRDRYPDGCEYCSEIKKTKPKELQ